MPEAPVSLEYNGLAYAVMMGTPANLDDFAVGFAITEGLAAGIAAVTDVSVAEVEHGWIVRAAIAGLGLEQMQERVRVRAAESSCGLCGIENLQAAMRALPRVAPHRAIDHAAVFAAREALPAMQELGQQTGAAHAAAWADGKGGIAMLREDVGRHNAMDKLIGAMARGRKGMADGFIFSTARCSYEIVEKAVRAGATSLVTISLPTDLAVERARTAGLSLWCLARDDSVLLVNDGSSSVMEPD